MLTNEQEEIIGEALIPLFQYLEHSVIVDVAQRILATMAYSRTAEIEAQRLQQLGYSPARIRKAAMKLLQSNPEFRKAVAKNTLEHKKTVKKLLREILKAAEAAGGQVMQESADLSYLDDLRTWKQAGKEITDNSYLPQLVEAIRKQTNENMKSLAGSAGFKTMSGFETMENLYRRELDKAMIKVCTGTFSREQVVYETVHSLAESGLRTIDFASGYNMQLDTAVKLAVRTGTGQIAAKIMDENVTRSGENLVYVSKHWGARNTGEGHANHEQWQGRVYYIKEGEDYSSEARRIGQDYITDLWRATGYSADGTHENDPLGLHGYNCRHKHYVWFPGSSLPDEDPQPDPVKVDGRTYDYYQITQKMRSMERKVRALKREREAMAALGQDTKAISGKIRQKIKDYQDFCKAAKVKPDINRLRYECKTSDLTKTKAWEKYNNMTESEKADTYRVDSNVVDMDYVNSAEYRKKFDSFSDSPEINNQIYTVAKQILQHRNGTDFEDMYLIHAKSGTIEGSQTESTDTLQVNYNESLINAIKNNKEKELIAIHNHPTNILPDGADYVSLGYRKYRQGIIATHNGKVYTYNVGNKPFTSGVLDRRIYKYHGAPYYLSMEEAHVKALETMMEDYGIEWRELE